MAWQLYRQPNRPELVEFLSQNEWGHVGFSSRLKETSGSMPLQSIYVRRSDRGEIREAMLHTTRGLLIPVFSPEGPGAEFRSVLFGKKPQKNIATVMGLRKNVELVQRLLEPAPRASVVYHTMILTQPPKFETTNSELVCKRATPRDAGLLYPLQKAYELEEVVLDPRSFQSGVCFRNLEKNLRREIVYYALIDGKPVAKAGTNARGFEFAQLGGVFTVENMRNRGVAECVLSVLLAEICRTMTGASLFVKKQNHAAVALYKKLGFRIEDEFKIAYYR